MGRSKIAEARGEAKGEAKGEASMAIRLLTRICGPLSDALNERVRQLPIQKLEALSNALLEFHSTDDLTTWLDSNPAE